MTSSGARHAAFRNGDGSAWYVVPADDKKNARLIVSEIILDAFNQLDMAYPRTTPKRRRELAAIRSGLVK